MNENIDKIHDELIEKMEEFMKGKKITPFDMIMVLNEFYCNGITSIFNTYNKNPQSHAQSSIKAHKFMEKIRADIMEVFGSDKEENITWN